MTTGIPSGTISIGPAQGPNVQMHQAYELNRKNHPWQEEEAITFKYEAASETHIEDYDTAEETCELPDFLEPSEFTPAPLGDVSSKRKSDKSSNVRTMRLPRTQIVLASQALAPHRDVAMGPLTEQAEYGPGISYSGTLFQPPTSRAEPLQSYSDEWWQQYSEGPTDTLPILWMALSEGGDTPTASAVTGLSPDPPPLPTVEPVPEPAGLLAIIAGLPGFALLRRRRSR